MTSTRISLVNASMLLLPYLCAVLFAVISHQQPIIQ